MQKKYRLVTRSDLDGLMCGALLNELEMIDDVIFTNASEMQKNKVIITENDIIANLPYNEKAYMCFDHHESEQIKNSFKKNLILDADCDSVSRVIFNYFGGSKRFKNISWQMIKEVDSTKGLGISYRDIIEPKKWVLLSIILDSRTNLEKFVGKDLTNPLNDFFIYFIDNIGVKKGKKDIEEIISHPDIMERESLLEKNYDKFNKQLEKLTYIDNNVAVLDFRDEEIIPGNRFSVFANSEAEINYVIYLNHGSERNTTAIGIRKNPLSKSMNKHIGLLLYKYGGGGNSIAGTCEISTLKEEKTIEDLIIELN